MRLIFLSFENMSPDDFPRILSPSMAHYELDRDYLFGGAAGMSICSQYRVVRNTQSGIGVTGYKEDTTMKRIVFDDLNHGELVAIGEGGGHLVAV